jgi:hypothetical protein
LVQEVPVYIYAVGLREILGYQLADGGEIGLLLVALILHILQLVRCGRGIAIAHSHRFWRINCCGGQIE